MAVSHCAHPCAQPFGQPLAVQIGFPADLSIDASILIADSDRKGLETLLRYCDRPPFAAGRLHATVGNNETLAYQLKNPLPDGKTVLILQPLDLIDRIAKLMPPPRAHRHR